MSKPIRVLRLREGRPSDVVNIPPTRETFSAVVGGEPLMLAMTDHYSIVVNKNAGKKARGNVRVLETNEVACGHLVGTVFVVERDDQGNLISMGEASLTAMRGYLESRRVGAC